MSADDMIRRGDALAVAQGQRNMSGEITAAIAALPAVTVGVHPLVWEHENDGNSAESAPSPFGRYYVERIANGARYWGPGIIVSTGYPTLEAAKAAAQADYEARILAALDLTPAPGAADDPECTDCGGSGVTYQTERHCSCQPAPDARVLVDQARFLAERLREWEGDYINHDEAGTQWIGNVIPPLVRLEAILALIQKGGA